MSAGPLGLTKVTSTEDIIDQGRFLLLLGDIPGGGDSDGLSIRCFNATVPGVSSEVMEVPMHGYTLRFRGRKMHTSPISVAFWEDSSMNTYRSLNDWMEAVTDTETGNSIGYLAEYSVDAQLSLFDTTGAEAARLMFYDAFPQEITDVQLTSESSAPLQIQVQFAYRNKEQLL